MIAAAIQFGGNEATRVVCVDDNPDVLLLLRSMVDHQPDMQCVAAFSTADETINFLLGSDQNHVPDVVLMDWSMPGMSVEDAIMAIHRFWPQVRVIVFTAHDCQQVKDHAIDAGAWGLVRKTLGMNALLDAIRKVKQGHVVLC